MRIDRHCHSKYSHDSYIEPEAIIEQAFENGLGGVCFMEHHSIGGSGCHFREQVGSAFTEFKNPVNSYDSLIPEIKNGNCIGRLVKG